MRLRVKGVKLPSLLLLYVCISLYTSRYSVDKDKITINPLQETRRATQSNTNCFIYQCVYIAICEYTYVIVYVHNGGRKRIIMLNI